MLESYQKLATNPRAQLAEYKYTRMGTKANVLTISNSEDVPATPGKELFGEPVVIASGLKSGGNTSITVADINGDGIMDIFVTGACFNDGHSNSVLIADTSGTYNIDTSILWPLSTRSMRHSGEISTTMGLSMSISAGTVKTSSGNRLRKSNGKM